MPDTLRFHEYPAGQRVEVAQADLTLETVDAIVNAANALLQHGGGIAAAIVRRGGWEIQQASDAWVRQHGPVLHDHPAYTTAGKLACRYVIHAVGPVWGEGDEDAKLDAAVTGALRRAAELSLATLALPAISTGIFGFPKERAAEIIFDSIDRFFLEKTTSLHLVRVVLFDLPTTEAFLKVWEHRTRL